MTTLTSINAAPDMPLLLSARDKAICDRYLELKSFAKVGAEFGIGGERARQVVRGAERRVRRGRRVGNS